MTWILAVFVNDSLNWLSGGMWLNRSSFCFTTRQEIEALRPAAVGHRGELPDCSEL